ncbi:MAG: dUTP diphosphatase [Victivallaceae bacterium]
MNIVLDEITVFCKTSEGASVPFYATEGSSGADVRAAVLSDVIISPGSHCLIPTGLFFHIPKGYEIQVRSRSGLALKYGIAVLNSPGTIDSDYRGELGVILINHGIEDFRVTPGLRIAQLVVAPVCKVCFSEVESVNDDTTRGSSGFGHTGEK